MKVNKQKIIVKLEDKPRNHVFLAMAKRNGAGTHEKPVKSQRNKEKVKLKKQFIF